MVSEGPRTESGCGVEQDHFLRVFPSAPSCSARIFPVLVQGEAGVSTKRKAVGQSSLWFMREEHVVGGQTGLDVSRDAVRRAR